MDWHQILNDVVYPAIASSLVGLLTAVVYKLLDVFNRWASTTRHAQAAGIVSDAIKAAWVNKLKPSLQAKLADGKMTDEEWDQLREEVKKLAQTQAYDRLSQLRGFGPKALGTWVEHQLDVALSDLLGRAFPGAEPEITADTPASEDGK